MRTIFAARASAILYRLAVGSSRPTGVHLLPANVCPVVPLSILSAGARFEFIDLDGETLQMSQNLLLRRVRDSSTDPVSSVVFVRTYGVENDPELSFDEIRRADPRLRIVDDRCLCRPVTDPYQLGSQTADVVLFSTGRAKQVDLGFGGFAHVGAEVSCPKVHRDYSAGHQKCVSKILSDHGRSHESLCHGADSSAASQLANAEWLDFSEPNIPWEAYRQKVDGLIAEREPHRTRINQIYRRTIPRRVQLGDGFHHWRFQIRVAESQVLMQRIFDAGFFASRHYFPSSTLFGERAFPVATRLSESIVNLFNDLHVSSDDALGLSEIVCRHLEERPDLPVEESR